jgi:hypothetical protein
MLGTAALLAQLLVLGGCSSNDTGGSGGNGGAAGSTVMTGSGGSTGAGGSTGTNPDPNCTSTNAKSGMSCTVDCTIPCGYQSLGTKICTCVGGVYSACPCPAPTAPAWQGALSAPYCDVVVPSDTSGLTTNLKNNPCDTMWQECIGRDAVTGTTPQGCVCLTNPVANPPAMQWYCGSTNKWFSLSM